jgi:diacylglycerol kinase (ATP)
MSESRLYCIANPAAARGRLRSLVSEALSYFAQNNVETSLLWTEYPRHGVKIAQELADAGVTRIVSMGGDGAAFEVINGVMRSGNAQKVTLGILPLGTGNSFLRDFSIVSWKDAAERIVKGESQRVDIGRVAILDRENSEAVYFHNMVGLGLIADACRLRHTRFPWMGTYAYHGAFFNLLMGMKSYSLSIRFGEGESISIQSPLLAICNSQYTGHNMHLSPRSNVQDGRFELLYTLPITTWELLGLFLGLPTGRHLNHPKTRTISIPSLEVQIEGIDYFMVDGEIVSGGRLLVEILPGFLSLSI